MALIEKIDRDDLYLYEVLRNPVLFTEFLNNYDRIESEEEFELSWYQKQLMLDFNNYVSIRAGRASGKTVTLVNYLLWLLVFNVFKNDYITYHVPNKVHLEPVWNGLIRVFRSNSFLKYVIGKNSGINSSDFRITLLNQASLICRIAGTSGTGATVIGLHTPIDIVDEAGVYPWSSFMEMQPTLNTFTPGHKMIVSGVPTGLREKNVLFSADQTSSTYSHHHITSYQNPRFTENDKQRAIEQYGGEESDDFIHHILAEHGKPVFALFDRSTMEISNNPVYRLAIDGITFGDDLNEYYLRLGGIPALEKGDNCIMGIDLGYTEPSAILILKINKGIIHFHARIKLSKVSYPIQEKLIDYLDSKFRPTIIGIDKGAGGQGISVVQHLLEHEDFLHKNYAKYLYPIDFSTSTVIGIDADGEEIKSKTKPFATGVLQDYCTNHRVVFSHTDIEMVTELERMTYTKSNTGEIIYRTLTIKGGQRGEDHFTAALLCAIMAHYLANDFIEQRRTKPKLFRGGWIG